MGMRVIVVMVMVMVMMMIVPAIRRHHMTGQVMRVIVLVRVDRELARARPEERDIFGMPGHGLGLAGAAEVAVDADHAVGRAHDDMEVVRDHQHAAAILALQAPDQIVEVELAGKIHPLHRLVEDQEVGVAQQGAGKQRALQLAAGQCVERCLTQFRNPGLVQDAVERAGRRPRRTEQQEP